jgi:hypothetical protein
VRKENGDIAKRAATWWWPGLLFICGRKPVFPEKRAQEQCFFPDVPWAVYSARTVISQREKQDRS